MNQAEVGQLPSIPKAERWESLDLIRGCAVLGIFGDEYPILCDARFGVHESDIFLEI